MNAPSLEILLSPVRSVGRSERAPRVHSGGARPSPGGAPAATAGGAPKNSMAFAAAAAEGGTAPVARVPQR